MSEFMGAPPGSTSSPRTALPFYLSLDLSRGGNEHPMILGNTMKDLKSPSVIWLKAGLLFVIGVASASILFLENHNLRSGLLLVLAIWAFCRSYYFAFYVIEHYVDSSYHFSGLWSFCCYLAKKKATRNDRRDEKPPSN